jgi:hypothetical protein
MPVEIMGLGIFVGSVLLITSLAFTYLERRLQAIEEILHDE